MDYDHSRDSLTTQFKTIVQKSISINLEKVNYKLLFIHFRPSFFGSP